MRTVADVASALRLVAEAWPDAIISDIGRPGCDGYDLIRTLRAAEGDGARLPAIALTSFTRTQDRDQALAPASTRTAPSACGLESGAADPAAAGSAPVTSRTPPPVLDSGCRPVSPSPS